MKIEEIMERLPHRYPFLLIDRVIDFEPNKMLLAVKNVSISDPFFRGHFPVKPIMPGVLILEALAQSAGILATFCADWISTSESLFYLGSIENARFKKVVVPGDQLFLKVELQAHRSNIWKFKGTATVDGEIVCTAEMTCAKGKSS